jgi:lipopolysaccharide transport system ATP-binding protein
MSVVIKVENISKQYRLGQVGTGTLSHDINRWWSKVRGKEDPYLKIGEANDRTKTGNSDYVWSLKDINFEVKQGEALGIIGKNGAGKSTLLKILSQVTTPTTGTIKAKGRIASLLEVGTGFHPELSGRENIFLNGAILGMTKQEIKSKFDEIVDFSGVERYIDTPVKRYSSGMYVRLAFAVAAHLEPEILIVDEVLAVGDAEFQKKCLGKMKDVAGQGRTVLFVSHNMEAVKNLTQNAVVLKNGELIYDGDTASAVNQYLRNNDLQNYLHFDTQEEALGNEFIKIKSIQLKYEGDILSVDKEIIIEIEFWNLTNFDDLLIGFDLIHISGITVLSSGNAFNTQTMALNKVQCIIPANFLNNDIYSVYLMFFNKNVMSIYSKADIITFEVEDAIRDNNHTGKINGVVRPKLNWSKSEH